MSYATNRQSDELRQHRHALLNVVDEAYSGRGGLSPGSLATVYRAVDALSVSGDCVGAACSQAISIELHRLRALLSSETVEMEGCTRIRSDLRKIAAQWLQSIPMSHFGEA